MDRAFLNPIASPGVWVAQLEASRIGRFDPASGQVREFTPQAPTRGPAG